MVKGEGMPVLFVEENGRYRCDESALRRVACSDATRGLPVAVVSVSGATRGGKSFLLDFFLRYLRASVAAQRNGSWLGDDDEPLSGFEWRGGSERLTKGILVWSEPIVVTVGSGDNQEKVAVVLLDTQGSFDSSSTVRDSSTLFAISTLLSSVQIYNLSQNIKEDDLQYLQLFTEYGKLARENDEAKPFQELQFLVRDWCWAYDHPVGGEGGQQLLDKRLQVRNEQAQELREVRTHIRGAFERVRGFLLPHPGLAAAANPAFTGCLNDTRQPQAFGGIQIKGAFPLLSHADISSEFKQALLELVPSLFDPEHLTVKQINGQRITFQDFVEYFKNYVEIFNSDTLPTPTTVMQATSSASLEAALKACREKYFAHMLHATCGAKCVPRDALQRHHAAAFLAARSAFSTRRTLTAPEIANARLDALLQELETALSDRIAINNGSILDTAAHCKAVYEEAMETNNCLAPEKLLTLHRSAITVAKGTFKKAFAARCDVTHDSHDNSPCDIEFNSGEEENERNEDGEDVDPSDEEQGDQEEHDRNEDGEDVEPSDEEQGNFCEDGEEYTDEAWNTLEKDLQELLPLHRERNMARIAAADLQARQLYLTRMQDGVSVAPCLHPHSLESLHRSTSAAALENFRNCWLDLFLPDECEAEFRAVMEEQYQGFVSTNDNNNKRAAEEAKDLYKNIMLEIFSGGGRCLHPKDMEIQHNGAQASATARFLERRDPASQVAPVDRYQKDVVKSLIPLYQSFAKRNEALNEEAVKSALEFYNTHIPQDMDVYMRHEDIEAFAMRHFRMRRRPGRNYIEDPYLDDLKKKINTSYTFIALKATAFVAAQGAMALGAIMFFRQ